MIRNRRNSGFTLIELMIVIAIIAILAAILVPNFIRARAQGQVTACKSNLKNIGTALEMYATDNAGRYPANLGDLTTAAGAGGGYLKTIPECPSAGSDTYSGAYHHTSNPDAYSVECSGTNHSAVNLAANCPWMDSATGLQETH